MNEDFYYTEVTDEDEEVSYNHTDIDTGEDDDSQDFDEEDLSLGFIRKVGTERGGINVYEFMFTIYPDEFWGEGFNVMPCSVCSFLEPDKKYVQKTVTVKMVQELNLVQDNSCFSMQDCMDLAVCLAVEDLTKLDSYPDYRLVFHFGEKYGDIEDKLAKCHILMGM